MLKASIFASLLIVSAGACTFGDLDGVSGGTLDAGAEASTVAEAGASTDGANEASTTSPDGSTCTPITDGLLGHWTLDAATIQDHTVLDSSPAKHNGSILGVLPTTTTGQFGEGLAFSANGVTHIEVGGLDLDTTKTGVTSVSFWASRSGDGINDVLLSLPWLTNRYDLWWTNGGTQLCFNTEANDCFGINDTGLRGRWVHVVAEFHNGPESSDVLYVDGVKRTLSCVSDPTYDCTFSGTVALPLAFGGSDSDFPFHGSFDDIRAYSRALTDAEVAALEAGTVCP